MMEPEGIGLNIRERRLELGLTQAQLADRAGIAAGYLSVVECQYVHRVPRRLPDIARALKTKPEALLKGIAGSN
ncbi:MAG TPA: helix-turn-helix transcriptional regulator [Chloroflexota bacterium]|nr:helix-turn-helix transcriptional regulator [Chloroflexota bacterium]